MSTGITMSDIAKKLGISEVSVSKALAGKSGVSGKLREEVLKTAKEMGYEPKKKAPSDKKQNTIGVIVAERFLVESRSYYWRIYQEITLAAKRMRCFTLLEVVSDAAERAAVLPRLLQQRVDGLIVLGAFAGPYLERMNGCGAVPLLALDSVPEAIDGDAVIADNMEGGFRMTEYLIQSGYRRIAYVGTLRVTPSIDDRYFGYYKAMFFHGFSLSEKWLIHDRDRESGRVDTKGCFVLPAKEEMPEAFFCNSDLSAQILVGKLKTAGYRVPEDIAVVGFDHYLPEQTEELELTTYEVDMEGLAREAVRLLVERLSDPGRPYRTLTVRGHLIAGGSVLPRSDHNGS